MMKFLINKASALGDIVHCYPVVSYLREKFPQCQIDWIVEKNCAGLVTSHPSIKNTHIIDTKLWRKTPFSKESRRQFSLFKEKLHQHRYDIVFDLQGNCKSALFTYLTRAKHKVGFGKRTVPEWPNLLTTNKKIDHPEHGNIRQRYLHIAQTYFNDFREPAHLNTTLSISDEEYAFLNSLPQSSRKCAAVCPGAFWKNKTLPISHLASFLHDLSNEYDFFFLWGNDREKKYADALAHEFSDSGAVMPKMSLPCLQNFFSRMDLVIAMDSLPLHLAGTTGTPTYSFFGPSSAEIYKPLGTQHRHIQGSCPYGVQFGNRCPKLRSCSTGACLRLIKPTKSSFT